MQVHKLFAVAIVIKFMSGDLKETEEMVSCRARTQASRAVGGYS